MCVLIYRLKVRGEETGINRLFYMFYPDQKIFKGKLSSQTIINQYFKFKNTYLDLFFKTLDN